MDSKLVLYDNPSRWGTCWSCNVWKTRLLLNFKGIDYETKWIHGPEIVPVLSSLGIEPHEPDTAIADYTIPAVSMPDGSNIMESRKIAAAVERMIPDPPVHLDSPVLHGVEKIMNRTLFFLQPMIVTRMPYHCLSGQTIDFHIASRRETFGMSLEEYAAKYGGERGWQRVTPHLQSLVSILDENPEGPFCLGSTSSYADFLIVGMLEWVRSVGGGCIERVYEIDGAFEELYRACKPWLERSDR